MCSSRRCSGCRAVDGCATGTLKRPTCITVPQCAYAHAQPVFFGKKNCDEKKKHRLLHHFSRRKRVLRLWVSILCERHRTQGHTLRPSSSRLRPKRSSTFLSPMMCHLPALLPLLTPPSSGTLPPPSFPYHSSIARTRRARSRLRTLHRAVNPSLH